MSEKCERGGRGRGREEAKEEGLVDREERERGRKRTTSLSTAIG